MMYYNMGYLHKLDGPCSVVRRKPRVSHVGRHLSIPRDYRVIDSIAVVSGMNSAVWRHERSDDGRGSEASRLENNSVYLFWSNNGHCKGAIKY